MADTIVVTTNADSGPGSLREAILTANANGTAVTDYITFNIPGASFNDRAITLVTELPALTSNLVIDGSTQPGLPFGTTESKVLIRKDDYAPQFTLFNITGASQVKIYGLYMFYGYWQGMFGAPYRSDKLFAVNLDKAFDIEIGAPGKGNVINGYHYGIFSRSDSCRDIRIKSNYIGQGRFYTNPADDIEDVVLSVVAAIELLNVKDILIGGTTAAEGNVIKANRAFNIDSRYETGNGYLKIMNNVFGKSYDRNTILGGYDSWTTNLTIGETDRYQGPSSRVSMDYKVDIIDNEIPTSFSISDLNKKLVIKGNHFDLIGSSSYSDGYSYKLIISHCADGEIGGNTDAEKNTFQFRGYNPKTAIHAFENGPITITKNIFECNVNLSTPTFIYSNKTPIPIVQMVTATPTGVSGIATPDCTIELFYDDPCSGCEGKVLIGITQSDAQGNWSYQGTITGTVVATATTAIGATGPFSIPETDAKNVIIKNPSCGLNNGSITGLAVTGSDGYRWVDQNGNEVANTLDLVNVGPGRYTFYAKWGNTCVNYGGSFDLVNYTPKIIDTLNKMLIHPSCGKNNGSIENIYIKEYYQSVIEWQDAGGNIYPGERIGDRVSIRNLYPGNYRLVIRDTTGGGCKDSTFYYELINQTGPAPDFNNLQITAATCNNNNGSITQLVMNNVTGTPFIQWLDSLNNVVGNSLDLLNQAPGKYRLKFKDQSSCDTIITAYFTIPVQGFIKLDSTALTITKADCAVNGSITGMVITGATGLKWIDVNTGAIIGNSANLNNAPPGLYQLIALNTFYNCNVPSGIYTIGKSEAVLNESLAQAKPDTCNLSLGAVTGIQVISEKPPVQYNWYDENNNLVANNRDLTGVKAGNYYLVAKDGGQCLITSKTFTVGNHSRIIPPPVYEDVVIPKGASVTISPKQPAAGNYSYLLFSNSNATVPLQQNNNGVYEFTNLFNNVVYYIASKTGDCISAKTPVSIKVVDESKILVPNAFTPNNDSRNNTWGITVIGIIKLQYIRVFNRWGQIVFETNDINRRWDGTFKGKTLSAGTYIWIVQATDYFGNPIKQKGPVNIFY